MDTISCTEFNYTIEELKDIWSIRQETLDVYFSMVQWAKKRDVIDNPEIVSIMRSILESIEEIADKNNCYEFEEVMEAYGKKWINFETKPKE